ncbi:MAG: PilZ domain-containing protein [Planctomycetota bacterium]
MDQPKDSATKDQRRDPRLPIDDDVTIAIDAQDLVGPGRNVSAQGVYFTTTGTIRVHVKISGQAATVAGELVRVEAMGDGSLGIAVRFLPPGQGA